MITWGLLGVVLILVGNDLWLNIPGKDFRLLGESRRLQVFTAFSLLAGVIWVWGLRYALADRKLDSRNISSVLSYLHQLPHLVRRLGALLLVFGASVFMNLLLTFFDQGGFGVALLTLILAAFLANVLWPRGYQSDDLRDGFFPSFVFTFAVAIIVSRLLSASSYPFSLGWSEGNRIWDYSLMFGSDRYIFPEGERIFGYISPGRSVVWGLPFLFPSVDIYIVRLWSQLVNIIPYTLFAFLLFPGPEKNRGERWLFALWGFLFLSQGPAYPHLIVAAVIMILGVRSRNLGLAAVLVGASAYFAFYSRWSWVFAPGLWAGMLALMQADQPSLRRQDWPKLVRPVVLGVAGLIGGQWVPLIFPLPSGTHPEEFSASGAVNVTGTEAFSQALLWDRLLPNATYGPGILLGLIMVVGPLLVWLVMIYRRQRSPLNALQKWGLAFPVLAFLVVGVIASTKIGGGGDLHNIDMFLVAMLILAAYHWRDALEWLTQAKISDHRHLIVLLMMLAPLVYTLRYSYSPPVQLPSPEKTAQVLDELQAEVDRAKSQGEVLFIDQRQLLTFGFIQDVPLVDAYEKKVLIDKAMSASMLYFDDFYRDIADQRFALIVNEPINLRLSGGEGPFAEENDVWVEWISTYLLEYYEVLVTYKPFGIQLLVPR